MCLSFLVFFCFFCLSLFVFTVCLCVFFFFSASHFLILHSNVVSFAIRTQNKTHQKPHCKKQMLNKFASTIEYFASPLMGKVNALNCFQHPHMIFWEMPFSNKLVILCKFVLRLFSPDNQTDMNAPPPPKNLWLYDTPTENVCHVAKS